VSETRHKAWRAGKWWENVLPNRNSVNVEDEQMEEQKEVQLVTGEYQGKP
jgi:hypothetical protein